MSNKFSQVRNKRSKPPHCKPGAIIAILPEHWKPKSLWCYLFWIDDRVPVDHNKFNSKFTIPAITPGEFYRGTPNFFKLTAEVKITIIGKWKEITVTVNIRLNSILQFGHNWHTGPIDTFFPISSEILTYRKLYPPQPWKEVVSHFYFSDPAFPFIPFPD